VIKKPPGFFKRRGKDTKGKKKKRKVKEVKKTPRGKRLRKTTN